MACLGCVGVAFSGTTRKADPLVCKVGRLSIDTLYLTYQPCILSANFLKFNSHYLVYLQAVKVIRQTEAIATITLEAAQITQVNATQLWNPYEVLDIYPARGDLSCIGTNRQNLRCGWLFFGKCHAIGSQVDEMAACEPSEISPEMLEMLARQCLCVENHQRQLQEKVRDWQDKVTKYLEVHYGTAMRVRDVRSFKSNCGPRMRKMKHLGIE